MVVQVQLESVLGSAISPTLILRLVLLELVEQFLPWRDVRTASLIMLEFVCSYFKCSTDTRFRLWRALQVI